MKKLFEYLLLLLFLTLYAEASCDSAASELHVQDCENHTVDVENHDGVCCSLPILIADYHFDECIWDGTAGEAQDSSGNNFNGTGIDGAGTIAGKLNNAGDFNGTSFVKVENQTALEVGKDNSDFSLSFWIKLKNGYDGINYRSIAHKGNSVTQRTFAIFMKQNSDRLHYRISTDSSWNEGRDSIAQISVGIWTHIVYVKKENKLQLYINKVKDSEEILDGNVTSNDGPIYMGDDPWHDGFNGQIDEFKIFNSALNETQIQEIYDNELARKNYDGTHRMSVDCTIPELLAEYRFDECKYTGSTGEVIDTSSGDNSGTLTGTDINIIKTEKRIGHALELNGGAVDINNLAVSLEAYKKHTVIFWMYWNGTNSIMPFGWNYHDLWLVSGYFGFNTAGGDLYGINSTGLANGWHHVAAVFTNEDIYSNRLYIDGVLQSLSQLKNTPNNTRAVVNTNARIGGWKANNGYRFKSYIDELKIYKGELDGVTIQTIHNNELLGKNYDGTNRNTIICAQAIFNAVNQNNGCFNWDNNITTKVSGDNINLTILSADENDDNTSLEDVNVTKLELLSFSDSGCSTHYETTEIWSGNEKVNSSACFNPVAFTHNKAVKCARIQITGIYKGESVESNSTDTFSLRPEKFILENIPAEKLTAEHDYTFQAKAVNSDGVTATTDFNTSVTPQSQKYFRDNSGGSAMDGTFAPTTDFIFTDGATADTTLRFDNVGKIGLELNDTIWAEVDSDDTLLSERTIYLEQNLTFIPDHFKVEFLTAPVMENNNSHFTYLSNDLNMGAWLKNLSVKVTAQGEQNATMTNYQSPNSTYFANSVDIATTLEVPKNPNLSYFPNGYSNHDISFSSGIAALNYQNIRFNYDRNYSQPVNPFTINGSDTNISIKITDYIDNSVDGNITDSFSGNSTFYFGKVIAGDIRTEQNSTTHHIAVDVFCDSCNNFTGFEQDSMHLYVNKLDDTTKLETYHFQPKENSSYISNSLLHETSADNILAINNGKIVFDIINKQNKPQKAIYHVNIPSWLWQSSYNDYNYTSTSNCSQHPCFEYIFEISGQSGSNGIKSGQFKGSHIKNDFNATMRKKAIKILR